MSKVKLLHVLMGGVPLGRIVEQGNRHILTYDPTWLARGARAIPLSLSLPLSADTHSGDTVTNYLWNLLPDSERTLLGWGRKFQVSHRNPFALLSHTGEDCPGAIQLVREDALSSMTGEGSVEWIDETEVERRIAELRRDAGTSGRSSGESGHFSLPGAQAKTALLLQDGRWGVPSGRTPTTHILKPPIPGLDGHVENEHVCLNAAAAVGLSAAATRVMRFGDEVVIVVERFDRIRQVNRILRSHQEDMCQALGVHPADKYEGDGGPAIRSIVLDVLRWSEDPLSDKRAFVRAVAFNQVIGGSDAHGKNYSIRHASGGRTRLAPLYDVASVWPYEPDARKLKMAMRVGGKYRFDAILPRHWEAEMAACKMQPEDALAPLRDMIARLPDIFSTVGARSIEGGLSRELVEPLTDAVARRCKGLAGRYGSEASADSSPDTEQDEDDAPPPP